MKQVILGTLFSFISAIALADTYYDATIVFLDGKSRKGLVESTFGDYILFKASEKASAEKIESSTLSKLIFTIKNEKREYHYL